MIKWIRTSVLSIKNSLSCGPDKEHLVGGGLDVAKGGVESISFSRVNSPTKSSTYCLLLLIKIPS